MQLLRIHNSQAQFNNRFNYRAGVNKEFVEAGSTITQTTTNSSNINIGNSALINTNSEFNLKGSNLVVKNDLEIIANNNLNITNSKNTQSTSSYNETTAIDTGL